MPKFWRGILLLSGSLLILLSSLMLLARRTAPAETWLGYIGKTDGAVYLVKADGTHTHRLPKPATRDFSPLLRLTPHLADAAPVLSPDGQHRAFLNPTGWQRDIFLSRADGTHPTRLTTFSQTDGDVIRFSWSPDSKWLLVTVAQISDRGMTHRIHLVSADGLAHHARLKNWDDVVAGDWSPDGAWFTFTPVGDLRAGLYLAKTDGSDVIYLEQAGKDVGWVSAWSPDGQWIAYTARCETVAGRCVYRIQANGEGREWLAGGQDGLSPYFARWSPDGQWLAIPDTANLFVLDTADGHLQKIGQGTGFNWATPTQPHWHEPLWMLFSGGLCCIFALHPRARFQTRPVRWYRP